MPKRSNWFQALVRDIRRNHADGAKVVESKELIDRQTQQPREVDIVIEGMMAGDRAVYSFECCDRKRPASVEWVEQMVKKHEVLDTNVLFLVSRSGFTKAGLAKAEQNNVRAVVFTEIDGTDVVSLMQELPRLVLKSWTVNAERVLISVEIPSDMKTRRIAVPPDLSLWRVDGTFVESIGDAVVRLLGTDLDLNEKLARDATAEHRWYEIVISDLENAGRPSIYLRWEDPPEFHRIVKIEVKGNLHVELARFDMRFALLGDVKVAWGNGSTSVVDVGAVVSKDKRGACGATVKYKSKPPASDEVPLPTSISDPDIR